MQIKDKRVIITGVASGLGLTISRELLRNGASIIAMIDAEESGKETVDILNKEFGRNRTIFYHCNIANNSEFDDTFKKAVKALGGLEILVNNADVTNETDFMKTIDVNVTSVIRATLLGIQQMQKDLGGKGGAIVNISSLAGLYAAPQLPVYSATKHAVVSFSRSFAQPYHYKRTGVKILVMCPELPQIIDVKNLENIPHDDVIQKYFRRMLSIAHGLVYVLRCAQNGSIWISENGKPVYEIQLFDSFLNNLKNIHIIFVIMWADTILIVFISICTALLGEGLTWLMVYRTEKYQKLKAEIEKQSKKLEKRKEAHGDSLDKQQKKKIEREEERLKNNNRDLSLVKMKSMFAIGFAFTALLSMFNSIFDGRIVARLPFVPISWIQGLSHRNLPGDDYTECSFIFLYILCTMSIRQNIQKMLGFAPSRTASKQSGSIFGPPPQQFK